MRICDNKLHEVDERAFNILAKSPRTYGTQMLLVFEVSISTVHYTVSDQ